MYTYRYLSIDFFKGLAVIGMVCFHLWGLLYYFSLVNIPTTQPLLFLMGKVAAITFIICSGFNFEFSRLKINSKKNIKRILKLALSAALMTVASYLLIPDWTIYFGILHFFTLTSILVLPLVYFNLNLWKYGAFLGILQLAIYLLQLYLPYTYLLLPFGYYPAEFMSLDYYPVFPWIYFTWAGIVAAQLEKKYLYLKKYEHKYSFFKNTVITFLGKFSLEIYLLHFPIIFAVVMMLKFIYG